MNQNEFTIVLPSNNSLLYFADNTTTNFSTRLPHEIELYGSWCVGISEIHIPCTILTLKKDKDTEIILSHDKTLRKTVRFQHGVYDTIETLIQLINETLPTEAMIKLFYNKSGGFVSIGQIRKNNVNGERYCNTITFSETVDHILGLNSPIVLQNENIRKNFDGFDIIANAEQPATLARAVPDQLFVYSNVCEPVITGDTFTQLLHIININAKEYNFGSTIVKRLSPITYKPLLTNRFQIVDIDIRDQFGKPIAFE